MKADGGCCGDCSFAELLGVDGSKGEGLADVGVVRPLRNRPLKKVMIKCECGVDSNGDERCSADRSDEGRE